MAFLTREQILAANDFTSEAVDVPEWGGSVLIRVMSGEALAAYRKSMWIIKGSNSTYDPSNREAKLLARCLCDDTGKLLFSEADVKALGAKSSIALERVHARALALNKLDEQSREETKKNSAATDTSCSPADTPQPSDGPTES